MASLPLLLNLLEELDRESNGSSYYGNNFGFDISPYMMQRQMPQRKTANMIGQSLPLGLHNNFHHRPVCRRNVKNDAPLSQVGKEGFQVCMNVAQFKPSDLNVKVVDNCIVIEGKHEEREDEQGFIQRHFVRRYVLPKDYDADKVVSTLSSDGVLTVSVPKPQIEEKSGERIIQIQQTGPAHLNIKENTQEKGEAAASQSTAEEQQQE